MILRITSKLGKKIGIDPATRLDCDPNPFIDWTADLFRAGRVQYILVTNTASLYSTLIYGKGIVDDMELSMRIVPRIIEHLQLDGFGLIAERLFAPNTGVIRFSKTLDRHVTGSMNELIYQAKCILSEEELSPHDVSMILNDLPMTYLKETFPKRAFEKLALG